MDNYNHYTLEIAKQIWSAATCYGDTKTRIRRAARWNSYYAYLANKMQREEQKTGAADISPDYFMQQLVQNKQLRTTDHVIDLGAGGGRYALQFAKQCSRVTAIDSCAENIELIRLRANKLDLDNIDCRQTFWEEYQPDQMYDVAFCSMCPVICSVEDIIRMEQMTKRLCCLITIAGGSYDEHRMRMLKELDIRPEGTLTEAIHYYNVLYLMDRQPSVIMQEIEQETEQSVDELMERYPIYFHIFGIPMDEARRYLSGYLERYAGNGVLREKSRYRLAMICWNPVR